MWQEVDKHQRAYFSYYGVPDTQQLLSVIRGESVLFTFEHDKYYVYFASLEHKKGYDKRELTQDPKEISVLTHLYQDSLIKQAGGADDANRFSDLKKIIVLEEMARVAGMKTNNIVHVQDPEGHTVMTFDNFPVYGQVMSSDLKEYFASDYNWAVFSSVGIQQHKIIDKFSSFEDSKKLLDLDLSLNTKYLLTSGQSGMKSEKIAPHPVEQGNIDLDGVVLWDAIQSEPRYKFRANRGLTYSALSPDNKYAVAGDANGVIYAWKTSGKNINRPLRYRAMRKLAGRPIIAIKFIDQKDFLCFYKDSSYAVLYNVNKKSPLKMFSLEKGSLLALDRDDAETLDSSPLAHTLVIAEGGNTSRVVEYQYDPKNKTLSRVFPGS